MVTDVDHDISSVTDRQEVFSPHADVSASYLDNSPFRHCLVRVDDEIVDDLTDLSGVDLYRPEVVGNVETACCPGAAEGKCDGFLDDFGNFGRFLYGCSPP